MGKILQYDLEQNKRKFIEQAISKHGNKYDYSSINYVNYHTKLDIICPIHGLFQQSPSRHLNSNGCNKCRLNSKSNRDIFIEKAISVHGNKYNYDRVNYLSNDTPVTIICSLHGPFDVRPRSHTSSKSGCPRCWKKSNVSAIDRAKIKFKGKYAYINERIICPIHGDTGYNIHQHLKSVHGCKECYEQSRRISPELYFTKVSALHNNKYKYITNLLSSTADILTIICPVHGEFKQAAGAHLYEKKGCWRCSHSPHTTEQFIEKSKAVHSIEYDYSTTQYTNIESKVTIICPLHGEFTQKAAYHLQGYLGCKRCSISSLQNKIANILDRLHIDYLLNDRSIISPLEIDIYIPSYKLGIEVHGNYFHSYNRPESYDEKMKHYTKATKAEEAGIKLLQFYEHEIDQKIDIIQSMIKHKLGLSQRLYARNCQISAITSKQAKEFFTASHIDGHCNATIYYGLYQNNRLVSAASFTNKLTGWEITRYATACEHIIIGGFSKLLKRFIKDVNPKSLMTYANRRFSNANVYSKNGFKVVKLTKPNYSYLSSSGKLIGSRHDYQKHKLPGILPQYNSSLTEAENMFVNGYRRLWDAGNIKLLYNFSSKNIT